VIHLPFAVESIAPNHTAWCRHEVCAVVANRWVRRVPIARPLVTHGLSPSLAAQHAATSLVNLGRGVCPLPVARFIRTYAGALVHRRAVSRCRGPEGKQHRTLEDESLAIRAAQPVQQPLQGIAGQEEIELFTILAREFQWSFARTDALMFLIGFVVMSSALPGRGG
jgi:hypothetical protein